jgi:murein tripeptide amidase MpaA
MRISSAFDGGNIVCLEADRADDIRLEIRLDRGSRHHQWFHYRLSGAKGAPCVMRILNAGETSYPDGWKNYRARASYDRETWFCVDTEYEDGVLAIRHTPERDAVWYAYFAPYSMERHADLIASCLASPRAALVPLGAALDGQEMDLLRIGKEGADKRVLWVIGRQHPGETMAEWWMEGFLRRLLDESDAAARTLLDKAVLYVVPNMNPDGARRGHLRTNAVGTNLNRAWLNPSMERSPEVFLVRRKMQETGLDFCLDVHGDEAIANNFIAGAQGIPGWTPRLAGLLGRYLDGLLARSPDFQVAEGYPVSAPGKANLKMATSWLAEHFDALTMTLEMPFKDAKVNPDPVSGWSPERCRELGRANLAVMADMVEALR